MRIFDLNPYLMPNAECNCNALGSYSDRCDVTSGQCECKNNVKGSTCNECVEATYNLESDVGEYWWTEG